MTLWEIRKETEKWKKEKERKRRKRKNTWAGSNKRDRKALLPDWIGSWSIKTWSIVVPFLIITINKNIHKH